MSEATVMLPILYQDDYFVIINKPAKLLVHKSPIDRHETQYAMRLIRDQIGAWVYPVHRLDKPTSGVLIFALSSEVAALMGEVFENHLIEKHYLAIVRGYVAEEGCIDHPIKETAMFKNEKGRFEAKAPKEAVTHFRKIAQVEIPYNVDKYPVSRYSLVQLSPVTGRQHQLRRHMKHIAHPIIGDPKYGKSVHNHFFETEFGVHRLLLHCHRMSFEHPVTSKRVSVKAELDEGLGSLLERFQWSGVLNRFIDEVSQH